jgi:deleted-in-malignant-brain-tumors protein 1
VRIIVGDSDEEFYSMSNNLRQLDYDSGFSIDDDMLSRGRIEVCNGTLYEAVCANGWNYTDASVVCRELGFSPYGIQKFILPPHSCHITSHAHL